MVVGGGVTKPAELLYGDLNYLASFQLLVYYSDPWTKKNNCRIHCNFTGLTFILTWNTTLSFLSQNIPEDYRTTLVSFLNSVVHGFGASFGYLLSGYLIQYYGSILTFKVYSSMCAVVAILFVGTIMVSLHLIPISYTLVWSNCSLVGWVICQYSWYLLLELECHDFDWPSPNATDCGLSTWDMVSTNNQYS